MFIRYQITNELVCLFVHKSSTLFFSQASSFPLASISTPDTTRISLDNRMPPLIIGFINHFSNRLLIEPSVANNQPIPTPMHEAAHIGVSGLNPPMPAEQTPAQMAIQIIEIISIALFDKQPVIHPDHMVLVTLRG